MALTEGGEGGQERRGLDQTLHMNLARRNALRF